MINEFENTVFTIHGLQPRDRTAILEVNTIEFFLEEFSWKHSLVPRGEKWFCSWPPSWPPWRHVQTNNRGNRTELRHLGGQPFRFHVVHSLWGKTFDCQLVIYIRLSALHFCSFFSPYLLFSRDSFFFGFRYCDSETKKAILSCRLASQPCCTSTIRLQTWT